MQTLCIRYVAVITAQQLCVCAAAERSCSCGDQQSLVISKAQLQAAIGVERQASG